MNRPAVGRRSGRTYAPSPPLPHARWAALPPSSCSTTSCPSAIRWDGAPASCSSAALVCLALLTAWQLRSVLRSPHPGLRATETLAVTVSLFLVLFAVGYQQIAAIDPSAFSEPVNRTDTLYFVVTVFSTVGFGDISPVSTAARVLASVQMLGDLVLIGVAVKAMLGAVERGRAEHRKEAPSSDASQPEPATSA